MGCFQIFNYYVNPLLVAVVQIPSSSLLKSQNTALEEGRGWIGPGRVVEMCVEV